jgi:hypothetical protein
LRGANSAALLAERGLAEAWSDVEPRDVCYCDVIGRGPDGGPGVVVSALAVHGGQPPRRLGYFPSDPSIQWTQVHAGLWMAIDKHYPPTPADLARRTRFPGVGVTLGDGQAWEVPVLRRIDSGEPCLPRDMFWDGAGDFVLTLQRRYEDLWRMVERVVDLYFRPESPGFGSIELEQALTIALAVLSLNYRLGPAEQQVLRLVNSVNWQEVLGAMVEMPKFLAFVQADAEKKSASPADSPLPNSSPGGVACSPTTAPVGQT